MQTEESKQGVKRNRTEDREVESDTKVVVKPSYNVVELGCFITLKIKSDGKTGDEYECLEVSPSKNWNSKGSLHYNAKTESFCFTANPGDDIPCEFIKKFNQVYELQKIIPEWGKKVFKDEKGLMKIYTTSKLECKYLINTNAEKKSIQERNMGFMKHYKLDDFIDAIKGKDVECNFEYNISGCYRYDNKYFVNIFPKCFTITRILGYYVNPDIYINAVELK
jgi:hypothetical protein